MLADTFLPGPAAHIKDALVAYDVPTSLDGAIDLAIRVDLRVQDCWRERLQMRHLVVAEEFSAVPSSACSVCWRGGTHAAGPHLTHRGGVEAAASVQPVPLLRWTR